MQRLKNLFGIIFIFTAGFLSGVAVTTLTSRDLSETRGADRTGQFAQRVINSLDLSEEQEELLQESVELARRELVKLREDLRPRIDDIWRQSMGSIMESLDEEQKIQLEEMLETRGRGQF